MHPQLAEYEKRDKGFRQFCLQYKLAADDADSRKDYYNWYARQMRASGEWLTALEQGMEKGREERNEYWLKVVVDKDAAIADKDAAIADKDAAIADKDAAIADKDAAILAQAAEIARLTELLKRT